jgi:type IX secretion system PorP/SprF family membrane protein
VKPYYFVILFVLLFFCGKPAKAQDVSFSQVYAAPLYLSPSFAGYTTGGRMILNYRDQWPAIANTFRSYAFSYDQYLENLNSGIGLLALRDDQGGGQLVTQNIGIVYAYELALTSELFFRPGLQFKYAERKIDPSRLTQVGPDGNPFPWLNADYPVEQFRKVDASASAMVYGNSFWVGATVDHLVKSNIGFTDVETSLPIKTVFFGGGKYRYIEAGRGKSEQSISLAFMFRKQQDFNQLDLGTYWYTSPIEVGLWYRGIPGLSSNSLGNNDALIFSLGVNVGPAFLAYSYDLTLSKLAGYSGGSNEFSLIYRFNIGSNSTRFGPIPCSETGSDGSYTRKYRARRRSFF